MTAPEPDIIVIQRRAPAGPGDGPLEWRGEDDAGNPTTGMAVISHAIPVEDGPVSEPEGGEPPSQETTEPAGTDSSDSSNPDGNSDENSANETPSPAPTVANPSVPAGKTESFSAGTTDGAGTGP